MDRRLLQRTGRAEYFHFLVGKAEANLEAGDLSTGEAALDEALRVARSIDSPALVARALAMRIRRHGRGGASEAARARDQAEMQDLCRRFGLVLPDRPAITA